MDIARLLNDTQLSKVSKISREVDKEYGDTGSCVMGYKLKIRDVYVIDQVWQGSIPNDIFYKRVKEYLLTETDAYNQPFTENDFTTVYGRMD